MFVCFMSGGCGVVWGGFGGWGVKGIVVTRGVGYEEEVGGGCVFWGEGVVFSKGKICLLNRIWRDI